jgi:hypothetical protein
MSTSTMIVMCLSFLLGLINQAVSQGSLFSGLVKVPPTWLPWLTIAASFLAGFVVSLQSASAINEQSILGAVMAGIMALGTAGGGAGVAHHVDTPRRMKMGRLSPPEAPKPA